MTHKEIIDIEQENTGYINLHLEGTFYKAYEQSAFAFCTRIKAYNVLRKESKTLGRDILYVGFPQSTLDKVLNRQMFTRVDEKTVRVTLSTPIDGNEFLVWRDAQEVEQASRAMLTPYSRVIENAPVYKTAYDLDRRWTEALCTESDPYVLLSVRNAREGFLKHFGRL